MIDIVVNPLPVLTVMDTTNCSPVMIDLTDPLLSMTDIGTLGYFSDGLGVTPLADETSVGSGDYYVIASSLGCTVSDTITVTINQTPIINAIDPAPVCSPLTVDITNPAVSGTNVGSLGYFTDTLGVTAVVSPAAVGTGTYYLIADNLGCSSLDSVTVVVVTTPMLIH